MAQPTHAFHNISQKFNTSYNVVTAGLNPTHTLQRSARPFARLSFLTFFEVTSTMVNDTMKTCAIKNMV
jgi:hypothetical protein